MIETQTVRYAITANGDGVLRERLFPEGSDVDSAMPITVIATDGENIPYGKPYSLAKRICNEEAGS